MRRIWRDEFEAVELRVGTIIESELLLTGFCREDGPVVLPVPEQAVPQGAKLG